MAASWETVNGFDNIASTRKLGFLFNSPVGIVPDIRITGCVMASERIRSINSKPVTLGIL